ncbi:MAG: ABC transporter substrate-binding protein [Oligoflexia bacterium]|nr:ABC transporter substrate-binding protein [Oligoflexia bacterium]
MMRWLFALIVVVLTSAAAYAESKKIGLILPLSGPAELMGSSLRGVAELAHLKRLTPVFEDDRCEGKTAISSYLKLKNEGVRIFYIACSGSILAVAPIAKRNGDLILTTYAGSARIRETGDEVIRLNPDAISVAQGVVHMLGKDLLPVAILYEEQEYASSFADRVAELLKDAAVEKVSYRAGEVSYSAELLRIRKKQPRSIIFAPVADGSAKLILKALSQNGINIPLIGEVNLCDFPFKPSDFGLHGRCVSARFDGEAYRQFLADYTNLLGHAPSFPFYDALALDLLQFLDREIDGATDVTALKLKILAGFSGKFAQYSLSPQGEPTSSDGYLINSDY